MRAASPLSEHSKIGRWVSEGNVDVLRVQASSVRDALSPWLWVLAAALALVTGAVSAVAGASNVFSVLAGIFVMGLVLTIVSYMRLALSSRVVEIRFAVEAIEICDGVKPVERCSLEDVRRLTIVHDGAPAKITINAGPKHYRWVIGQLYRHNQVARFVEEMPERLRLRLAAAGLEQTLTVRRGVLITESRRPGRHAKLVP